MNGATQCISRRTALQIAGSAGISSLAGCSGGSTDTENNYPSDDIEWIIPYSAGGGFDAYSRGLVEFMPEHLPNEVEIVPKNQPGAGGQTGANAIYRADPDGYTVGIFNVPGLVAVQLVDDTEYDMTEISWMGRIARAPYLLAVPDDSEYESLDDLQQADEVLYPTTSAAGTATLAFIISASVMDIDLQLVTGYEGSSEMVAATLRGDGDAIVLIYDSLQTPIEDGELRPLIALDDEPPEYAPETPTVDELGYEELVGTVSLQRPIGGPPGMDQARVDVLEEALGATVGDPELQQWAEDAGRPIDYADAAETTDMIEQAMDVYTEYEDLLREYQ